MIVVAGEALMDVYDAGATATGTMLDARMGGSPFNVAIGVMRLGGTAAFFGGISRGGLGERLVSALAAEGVVLDAIVRPAAPTTLALVGLDAAGVPDYAFYGEGAADRLVGPEALDRVPRVAAYQFGSYAMVVEPVAEALRRLVMREHERAVISWDPNIRLNVEPDLHRWRALFAAMVPLCHLIKVSDEDLGHLFPSVDADDLAREWLAAGVRLVVVTRGAGSVTVHHASGRVDMPAERVAVVDTVGAGDTFQAALLVGLEERGRLTIDGIGTLGTDEIRNILRFATVAAAITCSRRGADLPRRADVDAVLAAG